MTNLSRPVKFDVHTLVTGPFRGVGVVDKNTGSKLKGEVEWCYVRTGESYPFAAQYEEWQLRRAPWRRWLFRRNPDGTYQIGNNNLWAWIGTMILYGLFIYGVHGYAGPWFTAVRIIFPAFAVLYIFFTGRQYIGKSK